MEHGTDIQYVAPAIFIVITKNATAFLYNIKIAIDMGITLETFFS